MRRIWVTPLGSEQPRSRGTPLLEEPPRRGECEAVSQPCGAMLGGADDFMDTGVLPPQQAQQQLTPLGGSGTQAAFSPEHL